MNQCAIIVSVPDNNGSFFTYKHLSFYNLVNDFNIFYLLKMLLLRNSEVEKVYQGESNDQRNKKSERHC